MTPVLQTTPERHEPSRGGRLKAATGTTDVVLEEVLIRQLHDALPAVAGVYPMEEAAEAALAEIRPPDSIAGMLAAQFVAMHFANMDCLKQATAPNQLPAVRDMSLRQAAKLGGMGLRLLEAMERRQGRDPAPVMMGAFLNIQPGGQGIVGMQVTGIGAEMGASLSEPPESACGGGDERIKWMPDDADRNKRRARRG
jgi:hypothetical protein